MQYSSDHFSEQLNEFYEFKTKKSASNIDFFVVSPAIRPLVRSVQLQADFPSAPHPTSHAHQGSRESPWQAKAGVAAGSDALSLR